MNKEIFLTSASQSKQRKKYFIFQFCTLHAEFQNPLGWKPQPTGIPDFRQTERFQNESFSFSPKKLPGQKPQQIAKLDMLRANEAVRHAEPRNLHAMSESTPGIRPVRCGIVPF